MVIVGADTLAAGVPDAPDEPAGCLRLTARLAATAPAVAPARMTRYFLRPRAEAACGDCSSEANIRWG